MRIEEALERFQIQLEADGRSIHTRKQYARHVRLLAAWARDVAPCGDRLEGLAHEAVARFLASTAATGRERGGQKLATTANCLRSSLRVFLGHCHRAGYIATDSGRLIRRARCAPPPPKALSEEKERRRLETLSAATGAEAERDYALIHLLFASGIRLGSAVALGVEDIDLERAEVFLRSTKGDRRERVLLGKDIVEHLRGFLADRAAGALLTGATRNGLTGRRVHRRLGEWAKKAGITRTVSPHTCRHTRATRLYERTGDVALVKEALRHRSIASTMVYARASEARLRQVV